MQLVNRQSAPPQVGQNEELEEIDGRVAAFGITAGRRPARRNSGDHESSRIPDLQLSRAQPRNRRHFSRAVRSFQAHRVVGVYGSTPSGI